ncbi:MAG: ankyrin repeat domain-containing protein [Puniceicoccales bacterium]|jgi:hypothetical protein|nr:ankyrin repeat domain-containing protein [Puniceicoccales bacterium]
MDEKISRLVGRRAWIAGLVLGAAEISTVAVGSGVPEVPPYMPLEIPYLSGWTDRTKKDSRVVIGTNIVRIDGMKVLFESFSSGKSFNTNQQVMIGYLLPVIHFAASLQSGSVLKKILDENTAVVSIETALGNTPMHFAAANSQECLQLLIEDGRLDVNEHNYNGETPLYIAMKYNLSPEGGGQRPNKANVDLLLGCPRIRVNSRDVKGRTLLHIAVMYGEADIVKQILDLDADKTEYGDSKQTLDVNVKDDMGHTPADYLGALTDRELREKIQKLLHGAEAKYGDGEDVGE